MRTETTNRQPREWTETIGKFTVTKERHRAGDLWIYTISRSDRADLPASPNPIIFRAVSTYIRRCATEREIADIWEAQTETPVQIERIKVQRQGQQQLKAMRDQAVLRGLAAT